MPSPRWRRLTTTPLKQLSHPAVEALRCLRWKTLHPKHLIKLYHHQLFPETFDLALTQQVTKASVLSAVQSQILLALELAQTVLTRVMRNQVPRVHASTPLAHVGSPQLARTGYLHAAYVTKSGTPPAPIRKPQKYLPKHKWTKCLNHGLVHGVSQSLLPNLQDTEVPAMIQHLWKPQFHAHL